MHESNKGTCIFASCFVCATLYQSRFLCRLMSPFGFRLKLDKLSRKSIRCMGAVRSFYSLYVALPSVYLSTSNVRIWDHVCIYPGHYLRFSWDGWLARASRTLSTFRVRYWTISSSHVKSDPQWYTWINSCFNICCLKT